MKKRKSIIFLLAAVLLLSVTLQPLKASAASAVQYGDYVCNDGSDEVIIYRYLGSDKHVVIPSELGGRPVVGMEFFTYKMNGTQIILGNDFLESVDLPDSIISIQSNVFANCTKLKKVHFGRKQTYLSSGAFKGCGLLSDINMENVAGIASNVFEDCTGLKSADLTNAEYIGAYAFRNCVNLEKVAFGKQTQFYEGTFSNCPKISKIYFSKELETIDGYFLSGCDSVKDIYYEGSQEDWNKVAIDPAAADKLKGVTMHYNHPTFFDVNDADWFYPYVSYVNEKGLMTGLKNTAFGAGQALARAQFAVILHRMNQEPEVEYTAKFKDVADQQWYTNAILWANSEGIVTGYSDSGLFGTSDNINREQMAVMMYRYAKYKGEDVSVQGEVGQFKDASSVSGFAKEAMQWAVGTGIITGKDNGTRLDPQGNASRAECATIIMRFAEKFGM